MPKFPRPFDKFFFTGMTTPKTTIHTQQIERCRYQKTCERSNCHHLHETSSGTSPEFLRCSYKLRCNRPYCKALLHNTLDCLPPQKPCQEIHVTIKREVEIMSWNILSDPLAALMSDYYPTDIVKDRWIRIEAILIRSMTDDRIICLQEVALCSYPTLCRIADEHGYRVIYDSWGSEFNGKMGNAILVPLVFTIISKNRIRIGSEATIPSAKVFPQTITSIVLQFPQSQDKFIVATTHLPCRFKTPDVMMDMIKTIYRMMELAHYPVLFTGDFNQQWHELPLYHKIMNIWNYQSALPTTHGRVHEEDDAFCGCIDHILFTRKNVEWLPLTSSFHDDITEKIIPDDDHPSDHIPIYGRFNIHGSTGNEEDDR